MIFLVTTIPEDILKQNSDFKNLKIINSVKLKEEILEKYLQLNKDCADFMVNHEIASKIKNSIKSCKSKIIVYIINDYESIYILENLKNFINKKCPKVTEYCVMDTQEVLDILNCDIFDCVKTFSHKINQNNLKTL